MSDQVIPRQKFAYGKAEDKFLRLRVIVKVPFGEGTIEKVLAAIRSTGVRIIYSRAAQYPLFITDEHPKGGV